jgi:hypothetical protein
MKSKILWTVVALFLSCAPALAQFGPSPGPGPLPQIWNQNGAQIYYSNGCVTVSAIAPGTCAGGAGAFDADNIFASGTQLQNGNFTAGSGMGISGTWPNLTFTATGTTYTAGNGLHLSGTVFSINEAYSNTFTAGQTINLNAASLPSPQTGTILQIGQANSVTTRAELDSFAATPRYTCVREDGTAASPTTLQLGDELCSFNSFGYDGAAIVGPMAALRTYAAQNWTGSNQGTYADIAVTPDNSTTLAEVIRFENDGGITVPSTVTGGDEGAGKINAAGLYVNGTPVLTSATLALTIGSTPITGGTPNGLLFDSAGMVGNLATANSGLLVTSSGGVPSISTAIPNGVTATTQSAGDNSIKVATTAYVATATASAGFGVPGTSQNMVIVRASNTTLTVTYDMVIEGTSLGGTYYPAVSGSFTLNAGNTGANGLDTGSLTTSSFYCVYAITKGDGSTYATLLYKAGTCATIYPGANMPSGYVASALIGIWKTDGSSHFLVETIYGRHVWYQTPVSIFTNLTGPSSLTSQSISAAVPTVAKTADFIVGNSVSGSPLFILAGDGTGTGQSECAITGTTSPFANGACSLPQIPILSSQTIYWADQNNDTNDEMDVTGFTF